MAGSVHKDKESGKWYYMLTLYDENGKRKQKKKRGFKTKGEAKAALIEAENEVNKGTYVEPSKETFINFINEWYEIKKKSIPRSAKITRTYIDSYIIPMFDNNVSLGNLKLVHIDKFIKKMHEHPRDKDKIGYSPSTIKRALDVIKAALEYAVDSGLVPKNVAKKATLPKSTTNEMKVWDEDEIETFLNCAKDDKLYILYYLALMTGMRQGELLGLRWQDIDFKNHTLTIKQVLAHSGKEFYSGAKTKAGNRTIGLNSKTIEALKQHEQIIKQDKEKHGDGYIDNDLVICTTIGTPYNPSNVLNRSFKPLIEKAEVTPIRFHDLRHTHATMLLKLGENPKVISERLGHSNIKITLETYSHVLPTMQKQVATKLDSLSF
ncbi:tyrosine-type recombinase/integrase [Metabacillus halosaccharovorans]|uniref:tyrosine-type recombinase/integrase n=1 Tax=Metabacillus halosaccharovorans TaxID=930124 RepID=UPI00203E93A9|nr:site-specific integrase [Metabacillus halosaccharovorans]MCM3444353.1 tyrosine-type recombinase/integrase [Metabacillus halosaccharovorans]